MTSVDEQQDREHEDDLDCGDSVAHVERVTYEDAESYNVECVRCGAEWWEDKGDDVPNG